MCGSMVDIQSTAAEIRRGKKERKKERRKIEITGKIEWSALLHRATITIKATVYSAKIYRN